MNKHLTIIILVLLIVSCSTKYSDSGIEVIKYNNTVTNIQNKADTVYNEYKNDSTIRFEVYQLNSKTIATISYVADTLFAIGQENDGVVIALGEYYSNGQLKGKINFDKEGEIDGPAKYYYQNGRIKSIGHFTNGNRTGEWKRYNSDGHLETIEYYNEKGKIVEQETK